MMFSTTIVPYKGVSPVISPRAFIAPSSSLIGDVSIDEDASIWFGCVLRGDVASIRVGARSNVQDGTVIHVNAAKAEKDVERINTVIGVDVTVGHLCLLHACTLEDRAFVGMGSIVMDNAVCESDSILAAGSLLTFGKVARSGELWGGRPAKFMRKLTHSEIEEIRDMADRYVGWSKDYM